MSDINVYYAENDARLDTDKYLGFFGENGFGDPLSLNEYNGRTFITDASGSVAYEECDNCRKVSSSSVIVGQTGSGISLINLPNYLATVNIRFTHSQVVLVQSARLTAFDGVDLANPPDGVGVHGAEVIHTSRFQTDVGAGDSAWSQLQGSAHQLNLVDSPGTSGVSPLGPATTSTRHDWYVALSVMPTVPGSRIFSFQIDLEYV